jgi:hypothetical protein
MPTLSTQILAIEKLQKDFFYRVPALREMNYWQQLEHLKMLSLQRRLERYRILYVWKVIESKVPNCGIKVRGEEGRLGRMCEVPPLNTSASQSVQTMREQTFQVNGPKLFNSLPANIRNLTKCSIEDFKMALDKYLENIPDELNVSGLTPGGCTAEARASNSLLDQTRRARLTGRGA